MPLPPSDELSKPPVPHRIRAARELRGYTQRQAVDRMTTPISTAALSQIESGRTRPSTPTLRQLSAALDVPVEFFFSQRPTTDMGATFFRDLRATSGRERRRAGALALVLGDLLAAVELFVRLPEVDVPILSLPAGGHREDVEAAAEEVRRSWDLGIAPINHAVRTLERHGVAVARMTMGHEMVDAFSTTIGRRPLVLLTMDKSNYVRSRFDALHELGHFVLHSDVEPGSKEIELQAHDFASAMLLPREVAAAELPRRLDAAGWARLAEMKRVWGMSMAALLYRARTLGVMSRDSYQAAIKYMSSRGWRREEPGDREMGPPEAPLLLERSIRRAEVEGATSLDELIELAHLPRADTLALVQAAADHRPIVEL